jgi:hypothetical protein
MQFNVVCPVRFYNPEFESWDAEPIFFQPTVVQNNVFDTNFDERMVFCRQDFLVWLFPSRHAFSSLKCPDI